MKKKDLITTALVMVIVHFTAIAQFSAGLRVGAGLGNVSTPVIIDLIAPDFQYIPGIELGVIGEYRVNDRIAIMGEVNFREKGFRMSENMEVGLFGIDVPLGVRVDTRLRYLDMPIQFKYNLGRGPVQAYVSAGPQLGYAMNGRVKTKANFLIDWNLTNTPINLDAINYRRFEAGATMGAGVEFANGPGKIFADVRYYQGFTDSFRLPIAQLDIKNHGFGFGVGYKISL